ncbi:MAG: copper amine oxidase N-terminal domain-containing protein [Clostridiales bacterium]|nr:copper amine oxidase N-terminal domain-containing protein [Clostridiales bacterium]
MKKIFSLLLVLIFVLSFSVPVFTYSDLLAKGSDDSGYDDDSADNSVSTSPSPGASASPAASASPSSTPRPSGIASGTPESPETTPSAKPSAGVTASPENSSEDNRIELEHYRKLLEDEGSDDSLRKAWMKRIVELRKLGGDDSVIVFVNGREVVFDVSPVIISGRTLIPVRAVTSALGAAVDWKASAPNIIVISKEIADASGALKLKTIRINIKSGEVTVNGTVVKLDVKPRIVGNRTMVPIRFIAEAFGINIEWDDYIGGIVAGSSQISPAASASPSAAPPTPSAAPTVTPSLTPSAAPTAAPSVAPTASPSAAPSATPSAAT